jgi:hypothetical protein
MKKIKGAYVLLNKKKGEKEFKTAFFDTLLLAANAMNQLVNQPNPDKNIYIFSYSDYLIFRKYLEEDCTESYIKCFKIKPIEVEDLDNIFKCQGSELL